MKVLEYLNNLRPAIPMSAEKPCIPMSNGELRRHVQSGAVLFNGEKIAVDEEVDFPVHSLVFFPKGKRKTTIV